MAWVVAVTAVIALAGCGGGSGGASTDGSGTTSPTPSEAEEANQAERIEGQVDMFTAAFGSGDIATACALIDDQTISERMCRSIYGGNSTAFERSFLTAKIERVVVNGEFATVGLNNGQILRMKEVGENWLVEDFGGAENTTG
jgi:hypothetical protein